MGGYRRARLSIGAFGCNYGIPERGRKPVKERYLEVTFRGGRPIAAYYYLPRRAGEKSFRTARVEPGLIIDYGRGGNPIGIEITAPSKLSLLAIKRVLKGLGLAAVTRTDLAPLRAA